jgi:hypothetical protein
MTGDFRTRRRSAADSSEGTEPPMREISSPAKKLGRILARRLGRVFDQPLPRRQPTTIHGRIEIANSVEVSGWVALPSPNAVVQVALIVGGVPVLTLPAALPRPDLDGQPGVVGAGGFRFDLDGLGLSDHELPVRPAMEVRVVGADTPLPGPAIPDWSSGLAFDEQRFGVFDFHLDEAAPAILISPEELARMRVLRDRSPFDCILVRIRQRLTEESLAVVEGKSFRYRGLAWRNHLEDAALLAAVAEDAAALARWEAFSVRLRDRLAVDPKYFPDEVNAGLCVVGLATGLALLRAAGTSPERLAAAETCLATLGKMLWRMQARAIWSGRSRDRLAWNHGTIGYTAAGLAALSIGGSERWRRRAMAEGARRAQAWLRYGVDEAGMAREGVTYAGFTLGVVGPFLPALFDAYPVRHYFHAAPGCGEGKYERLLEWLRFDRLPGEPRLTAWNDSYAEPHVALRGFLALPAPGLAPMAARLWDMLVGEGGDRSFGDAARHHNSILACSYTVFAAAVAHPKSAGLRGVTRFFPTDGYLYARTDWSQRAAQLIFKCGPHTPGLHGQADIGSFTLAFDGHPVIVDSGAANETAPDSPSQWRAHSVLSVDGRGQGQAARGAGVNGRILMRKEAADFVYALADVAPAYSRGLLTHGARHMLFLKDPVALVLWDEAAPADRNAKLEQRFQIAPRFGDPEQLAPGRFRLRAEDAGGVLFLFATPPEAVRRERIATREGPHPADVYIHRAGTVSPLVVIAPFSETEPDIVLLSGDRPGAALLRIGQRRLRLALPSRETAFLGIGAAVPEEQLIAEQSADSRPAPSR